MKNIIQWFQEFRILKEFIYIEIKDTICLCYITNLFFFFSSCVSFLLFIGSWQTEKWCITTNNWCGLKYKKISSQTNESVLKNKIWLDNFQFSSSCEINQPSPVSLSYLWAFESAIHFQHHISDNALKHFLWFHLLYCSQIFIYFHVFFPVKNNMSVSSLLFLSALLISPVLLWIL